MMPFSTGEIFTRKFIVTSSVYQGFIRTFEDRNPLHTDKDYATSMGFKNIVMHGNILNGFISYFIGECLPSKNVIIHSQEINFSGPVYMGDILTFEAKVDSIHESVNAVTFDFIFRNELNKKVAKGCFQIGVL